EELRPRELQEYLRRRLPEYMIPAAWMRLEELPLTPNGKVDRRALAALTQAEPKDGAADVAPQTPTEKEIAEIWKEILNLEQIGIHDNFFELGGHSLLATQLIARIRMAFGVSLKIRDFFISPTIKDVAEAVDEEILSASDSKTLDELLAKLEDM